MAENQSIKERLICFISSLNISIRSFERECGLSNGFVKNIRQSIQPDKLNKIVEQYATLNPGWLMTGEGTMFRVDATASTEEEEIAKKTDMYKTVVEDNQRLREENEELKKRIERLEKMVDRLLGDSAITPSKCNG